MSRQTEAMCYRILKNQRVLDAKLKLLMAFGPLSKFHPMVYTKVDVALWLSVAQEEVLDFPIKCDYPA
jgi:hypothetical protein